MKHLFAAVCFVLGLAGCSAEGPERTRNKSDSGLSTSSAESSSGDATGSASSTGAAASMGTPDLRWMIMGDQPLTSLASVPDCAADGNIARSVCTTTEAKCRSKFVVTCDSSTECRRLFKCVTGTGAGNIWFAMGDTTPVGTLPVCPGVTGVGIAGTGCATLNDRCLSSFLTATGNPRLFKCLPSGGPGLLFWRWMDDKPVGELAGIETCLVNENIAGTPCVTENSKCVSSFCTTGTGPNCTAKRLFKCTP